MTTIIVTDVFGRTAELEEFSRLFRDAVIVDPYQGKNHNLFDDKSAYQFFVSNCGFEKYTEILREAVSRIMDKKLIIGFSAGAAAAWNISDRVGDADRIVCFYGSRIRDNADLEPACPVRLVFPAYEESFDVNSLIERIQGRKNVSVEQTKYLHGFMNKLSKNWDADAYQYFSDKIKEIQ